MKDPNRPETGDISVKSIILHYVRVPLKEPFRISNGSVAEKDAVIIELMTADGITGWGEASPMSGSFYSGDTPESVWTILAEKFVPMLLAERSVRAPDYYLKLREVAGEPFAKAGIEGALWDAWAKTLNRPLCELFGATKIKPITSGVAIGIYDKIEQLLERVERYRAEGYRRVKIKIQPGWDLEPVAAIRAKFSALPLMVDANAAYNFAKHKDIFRQLDQSNLLMIEQPLARDSHDDAARLQQELKTPLCADESAESLAALDQIIEKRAARIINIKVQRVGGLSEALLMLSKARAANLECWVGTMPELGIATAQGLHFAALDQFAYPTDIEASARWYTDDLIEPAIQINSDGLIHLPEGAGTGFHTSPEKLKRYTLATRVFKSQI